MTTSFERFCKEPGFRAMFAASHQRRWSKNRVVLAEGEPPRSLYFLMAGSIAVRLSNWRGREVLLAYMHPGDFFGEMGLFPGMLGRSALVQTRSECRALEIAYPRFLELTAQHPALWLELAGQLGERLRAANRRLAEMPLLPVADRVWSVIVELAEHADSVHTSEGAALRVTRQDLGKLAGCSREAAGLALRQFADDGRLILRGQRVLVRPQRSSA